MSSSQQEERTRNRSRQSSSNDGSPLLSIRSNLLICIVVCMTGLIWLGQYDVRRGAGTIEDDMTARWEEEEERVFILPTNRYNDTHNTKKSTRIHNRRGTNDDTDDSEQKSKAPSLLSRIIRAFSLFQDHDKERSSFQYADKRKKMRHYRKERRRSYYSMAATTPDEINIRPFRGASMVKKRKRNYPRILYFVHIHKSAGTLVCSYAHENKLSVSFVHNCNVQKDQRCCGNQDTVEAQIEYANKSKWDLVAIEREMYDSMAPDHYDYIASLRKSKDRYYSHWGHLRRHVPLVDNNNVIAIRKRTEGIGTAAWLMNASTVDRRTDSKDRRDPLGTFQYWYHRQPDNWNTRIFCGPKCMSMPKYQISRDMFYSYILKERLDKFRHFVFVENMTASMDQLATAYNWTIQPEKKVKNQRSDHHTAREQLEEEPWDFKMSALDDAIYEFAQRKYNNVSFSKLWANFTNQEELDLYFSEGPKDGCKNACCGLCSLY